MMTERLDKSNVAKEAATPLQQYVPVIVGVVVAVVAALLVLLIFYFCVWRKGKKGEDVESSRINRSTLEETYSINRKSSFIGQEVRPNWTASIEDSEVMSSVGQSSFPGQFISDELTDTVQIPMTSVAVSEEEANSAPSPLFLRCTSYRSVSNQEDNKDEACSPSSVEEQASQDSFFSARMSTLQQSSNPTASLIPEADSTNDFSSEVDCKNSKDVLKIDIEGPGEIVPSSISVKLEQKLIQRKRAQEQSNPSALVASSSNCENKSNRGEQDHTKAKKCPNYDNNTFEDSKCSRESSEIKHGGNCESYDQNYSASKDLEEGTSGDILLDGGSEDVGRDGNILLDGGRDGDILPFESPDGGSKELDWDSSHEPLKTRTSVLKLVCTPSQPSKSKIVTSQNSNFEDSLIEGDEIDVENVKPDSECREEEIPDLDWDSSHEPLETRRSVLKRVPKANNKS